MPPISAHNCVPCRSRLRHIIDRAIYDTIDAYPVITTGSWARAAWGRLPVVGDIPLPTVSELATHIRDNHMMAREQLLDHEETLRQALAEVMNPAPPPAPKRPKRRSKSHWSANAMAARQRWTGWTPEMQLALREAQGNTCAICHAGPPDHLRARRTPLPTGGTRVTVYGLVCDSCRLIPIDPEILTRALEVINNPPALLVS